MLPAPGADRSCALAGTAKSNKSAMAAMRIMAVPAVMVPMPQSAQREVTVGNQVMGSQAPRHGLHAGIAAADEDAEVGARLFEHPPVDMRLTSGLFEVADPLRATCQPLPEEPLRALAGVGWVCRLRCFT